MKTVTFNSNFGQFKNRITGQFPDELADVIAQCALADILYRVCGSKADKGLGVNVKKPELGQVTFKDRKSVPYSEANCIVISGAVEAKIKELEKMDDPDGAAYRTLALKFAITGQHVFGEVVSAMVMATTLVDQMERDPEIAAAYQTVFEAMGYSGDGSRTSLIEFAHSKGLGVRPASK